MKERLLVSQIERILDNEAGPFQDVIIALGNGDQDEGAVISAALSTINNRSMVVNARDLLPPPAESVRDKQHAAKKRVLRAKETSLFANLSLAQISSISPDVLFNSFSARAKKLLSSGLLVRSIDRTNEKLKDKAPKPVVLRSAESVRLLVHRDDLEQIRDDLRQTPELAEDIRGISPNHTISPPRYSVTHAVPHQMKDGLYRATWGVSRIGAPAAWGAFDARGQGVKVAVLDTGVDASHPDLTKNDGTSKVVSWAEFGVGAERVQNSQPHDTDGHGTHVCATVAGGRASGKWIGIAPEAELCVALVLDGKKGGTDAQVLAGIDWAIEQKVDVINLSLGGFNIEPIVNPSYQRALVNAMRSGIVVVASIGNEGSQTSGTPGNDIFCFSVGAVDIVDRVAGFSGGRTQLLEKSAYIEDKYLPLVYSKPDVTAPGVYVYSAIPNGKWEYFSGTSMATPHVSGAVAVLLSSTGFDGFEPHEKASLVKDLIMGSVDDLGESGQDHRYGFGRVNLFRAVDAALGLNY